MNENNSFKGNVSEAYFKFGLIAPVIQGTHGEVSEAAYYRRVTAGPIKRPDGSYFTYCPKTLQNWVCSYRKYGFDGLMSRERLDKGTSRALSDAAIERIYELKKDFPRLNATQIHFRMQQEGVIPKSVSVCAVQRFIKKNDLKFCHDENIRDRKAFEESAFGRMWQCDTCHLTYLTENGSKKKVYAMALIDDHSRMIVGADLFYADTAKNFQTLFKDAVATYGIPTKLLTDNGAPYSNEQLKLICGTIGTALIHLRPRDGAGKGKIERFWRTLNTTWLYTINMADYKSLDELRSDFRNAIYKYNTSKHSGIGCAPIDRYLKTKDNIRAAASREWLDESFLNRIYRKVRKDATISIDKVYYDVPAHLISNKVEVRYIPGDMDSAVILCGKERHRITPTDKNANCHARRDSSIALDYGKAGDDV